MLKTLNDIINELESQVEPLREQKIKYPNSPVYGAINIDDKGLIYVAKMNEKGELELS